MANRVSLSRIDALLVLALILDAQLEMEEADQTMQAIRLSQAASIMADAIRSNR